MNPTPDSLSPLRARLGAVLETVLNLAARIDPDLHADLATLEGRSIALTWSAPQWSLRLSVEQGALKVGPNRGESDLSLATTLSGLIGLLRPEAKGSLPVGRVNISGDAELLRRVEQIAKRFAPDWDAAFARHLGPVLGPQIGRALAEGLRAARSGATSFAETTSEYLREESRDVATREELAAFADEVDHLRDGVDRLDARLNRIAKARA
ncbi:MAG: SCP2 sterol-binding domain-containing protein [Rhodanobacteraceae bacterium]|nr:SCP2 sterol-binding domain-containing protein [Rhodanobacteraceae bacterium]MBL0040003.1 SCP2 sterol-binding domain-containing protein [Xanthomonadales bacterium]MBP6078401.1 SCP2 sterol-binding domain-containing protein [Xanthomonadales bacterium]MBP7623531.1 SCP2 sterol-binding domain-containing protein [Xanthomonadales bacterium]